MNAFMEIKKAFNCNDTKRKWNGVFNLNTLEYSEPWDFAELQSRNLYIPKPEQKIEPRKISPLELSSWIYVMKDTGLWNHLNLLEHSLNSILSSWFLFANCAVRAFSYISAFRTFWINKFNLVEFMQSKSSCSHFC